MKDVFIIDKYIKHHDKHLSLIYKIHMTNIIYIDTHGTYTFVTDKYERKKQKTNICSSYIKKYERILFLKKYFTIKHMTKKLLLKNI